MKISTLIACTAFLSAANSQGAVYALFTAQLQSTSGGSVGNASGLVSANTFPTTPTLTRGGGTTINAGGEAAYTDFQGFVWSGSGTHETPGRSFGWSGGSTGATLTLTLNMTNLEDLTIRMAIQAQGNNGATPISSFSSIQYSTNNGVSFSNAATGSALNFATGSAFNEYLLDLSALPIDNTSQVQIRFNAPTLPADTALRLDNILLTAQTIPEPSSAAFALAAGLILFRRKRSI